MRGACYTNTRHAMEQVMHEAMQSGNPHSIRSNPEFQASLQEMMQVILVVLIQLNQYELVQMGDDRLTCCSIPLRVLCSLLYLYGCL